MPNEIGLPIGGNGLFPGGGNTGPDAGAGGGTCSSRGCVAGTVNSTPSPDSPGPGPSTKVCCLSATETIRLADGTAKAIGELQVGDVVLGGCTGATRAQEVTKIVRSVQSLVRVVHAQGEFICSTSHRVATTEGYVGIASLRPGSCLIGESGLITVIETEAAGEGEVVGITCEPDHTYFAAGVLHHNTKIDWIIQPV